MKPWDEDCLHLGLDDTETFNPLLTSGYAPLSEADLALIEAACEAATPGPLVIDDHAEGEGVVVATLPDGRHVVSLASGESSDDPATAAANAQLIRHARCWLLRLLRDRERLQLEREELLARLARAESIPDYPPPRQMRSRQPISSIPR